jgi:hypothetical protein
MPAPAQPPPSPYDPSMQAGGLAPPPPMDPTIPSPQPVKKPDPTTEEQLEEAKDKDAGRGLSFFYLNAEAGFEHVGLQTFNIDEENFTAGFVDTESSGAVIGTGVGVQVLFLTVGARGRVGFFDAWQLFSVGGEVGFRFPFGRFEPHFELGGGYTALGSFNDAISGAADAISIHGFHARVGGGLDFFPTSILSIGANVSWEFLALTRPGISFAELQKIQSDPATTDVQRAKAELLQAEGSGYGSAVAITGVVGLHF